MMKNLTLALSVMIIASPAFASRARLEALGENKNGSYYIQDSRNIFLNPAQIVHYKKKLFLELGTEPGAKVDGVPTGVGTAAASANYRGQGGFTNTFGDYTYGIYLNNNSDRAESVVQQINAIPTAPFGTFLGPDRTIEAFFAGEGAIGWGVSVFYAGNNGNVIIAGSGVQQTSHLLGARLGVEAGNLQVFSTVGITSSSKLNTGAGPEIKGKVSVDAAATYGMEDWTFFGKFMTYGTDLNGTAFAATPESRNLGFGAGVGYKHEASKTVTMYARLEGDYLKNDINNSPNLQVLQSIKYWNVPVVFAAEAQALSWLTVRGSVAQSLAGQALQGGAHTSLQNTTTVAAGVGLTFGDIQVDGLVATNGLQNSANTGYNTYPGFGTGPQTNTGFGFGDNMISRIALTYNF